MQNVKIKVSKYKREIEEYYMYEDIFCTNCGEKGHVYSRLGNECYYQGATYYCINCSSVAMEPCFHKTENDESIIALKKTLEKALELDKKED